MGVVSFVVSQILHGQGLRCKTTKQGEGPVSKLSHGVQLGCRPPPMGRMPWNTYAKDLWGRGSGG